MARLGAGHALEIVHGRAELLLQPQTFLRLAPGAGVEMLSDDLTSVRLRVVGTAILDVGSASRVTVACADWTLEAAKPGVFRLACGNKGEVRAQRGSATVTRGSARVKLKTSGARRDAFDLWSAERSARARRMQSGTRPPSPTADPTFTDPDDIRRLLEIGAK
jgi:hypothetical protein